VLCRTNSDILSNCVGYGENPQQEMKKSRSDIEVDEHRNRFRKSTHYSSKKAVNRTKKTPEPQN
jgi:hypothetical protein